VADEQVAQPDLTLLGGQITEMGRDVRLMRLQVTSSTSPAGRTHAISFSLGSKTSLRPTATS
jgi:hypothetical protein